MGLYSSSRRSACNYGNSRPDPPNPDPYKFRIIRAKKIGKYTIAEVKYDGCTNYEGKKILVYDEPNLDVTTAAYLDPHFCEHKEHPSPIARFAPTQEGWWNAIRFVNMLNS